MTSLKVLMTVAVLLCIGVGLSKFVEKHSMTFRNLLVFSNATGIADISPALLFDALISCYHRPLTFMKLHTGMEDGRDRKICTL